jgi:hypothetical protein
MRIGPFGKDAALVGDDMAATVKPATTETAASVIVRIVFILFLLSLF